MTETHLSQATMKSAALTFRIGGRAMNREVRSLFSAPAPLSIGSTWAGTWSGVATISDWPSTKLEIPWPQDHWESARVLVSRHWIGQIPVVIGGFYGYSQGPTWPKSKQLSDSLLATMSQDIVIGMQGIRIILLNFINPGESMRERCKKAFYFLSMPVKVHDT